MNALSHRERVSSTQRPANCRPSSGLRPPSPGGRRTIGEGTFRVSQTQRETKPNRRAKRSQTVAPNEAIRGAKRSQTVAPNEANHDAKRSQTIAPNEANLGAKRSQAVAPNEANLARETKPSRPRRTKPIFRTERSQWILVIHCERGGYGIESDRRGSRMERSFKPILTRPSATLSRRERGRNSRFPAQDEAKLAAPNEANHAAKPSQTRCAERSQTRRETKPNRRAERSRSRRKTKPRDERQTKPRTSRFRSKE